MPWKEFKCRLQSSAPLLMKNGQTADPTSPFAKASKQITSKRKKTDADYAELLKIDFLGGLYMNERGPCIPGRSIDAMILAAAKTERRGKDAASGVRCDGTFDLIYDGPRDAESLYETHRDVRAVRIQSSKTMRCRPIFDSWAVDVVVHFNDAVVDVADVKRWLDVGGNLIGICDYRPKYGRFEVAA